MAEVGIYLLSSYQIMFLPCIAIALTFVFALHFFFLRKPQRPSGGLTNYPILGFHLSLIKNMHRFHDWIAELLSFYPSNTFKYHRPGGVRGFMTANPANVEHILKTNFQNYEKGERLKLLLHDFMGRGIFNVDGDLWKMQRKAASYEFNTKSLRNFVVETVQSEILDRLIPVLSKACNEGGSINLQDVLQRFTFDNICRVAFGVDPGYLHPSLQQISFAQAFDDATELSFRRNFYIVPYLWRIKRMLNIGSERRLREAIREVDEFTLGIIRSRRNEIEENQSKRSNPLRNDLLSRFMAALATDSNEFIGVEKNISSTEKTDQFLKEMLVSIMLAGRDTTSTSLTWFFWVLSCHRRVEEAIQREIMEVLAKTEDQVADKGIMFSYEELRDMEYLHAAVCESLRLYPPVPLDTKAAVQDDVLPDGSFVGKGWGMNYSMYAMGRMVSIWGADCLEFKPERWFVDGKFVGENPYKFTAFNAGPRICLGKEMAFIQMKSIVASIIHKFSLKLDKEFVPRYTLDFNMRMKGGLAVTVTKRVIKD